MNKRYINIIMLMFCISCLFITSSLSAETMGPGSGDKSNGKLIIEIMDLKSNKGKVYVYLYDSEDGYPMKFEKSILSGQTGISDNKAVFEFADIPYGPYAVCVYHDENDNGKLDTNFIGIPKEGIAASNDAKGKIGPPKYKDAVFEMNKPELKISVHMVYI